MHTDVRLCVHLPFCAIVLARFSTCDQVHLPWRVWFGRRRFLSFCKLLALTQNSSKGILVEPTEWFIHGSIHRAAVPWHVRIPIYMNNVFFSSLSRRTPGKNSAGSAASKLNPSVDDSSQRKQVRPVRRFAHNSRQIPINDRVNSSVGSIATRERHNKPGK